MTKKQKKEQSKAVRSAAQKASWARRKRVEKSPTVFDLIGDTKSDMPQEVPVRERLERYQKENKLLEDRNIKLRRQLEHVVHLAEAMQNVVRTIRTIADIDMYTYP